MEASFKKGVIGMGTPISNQPKQRTALEVFRDFVQGSEHSVAESDLRQVGIDVDILEATYEANIRPHIDYLHGYKPLEELDPVETYERPRKLSFQQYVQSETWLDVLGRFGQLNQHLQVLTVVDVHLYHCSHTWSSPTNIRIRISLTRKGTWLFWYLETNHEGRVDKAKLATERLSAHETVRELWQKVHELVPDKYSIGFRRFDAPKTVPLSIEFGLRRLLQDTISERNKRLEGMKGSLMNASQRASIIAYKR